MQLKSGMTSFKCEYCHSVYFPDKDDEGVRVLGEQSGDACPVCKVPLMKAAVSNFRIVYCTTCRGMLIPMEEFQVLIDELQSQQRDTIVQTAADPQDLRRSIDCPHCHHPMEAHYYAGPGNVVIDSCDTCSLNWLDHGELMRISHAPDEYHPATSFAATTGYFDEAADFNLGNSSSNLRWQDPLNTSNSSGSGILGAIGSLFRR